MEHLPRKSSVSANITENHSSNVELDATSSPSVAKLTDEKLSMLKKIEDNSTFQTTSAARWSFKSLLICSRFRKKGGEDRYRLRPEEQFRHVVLLTVTYGLCTAPPMIFLAADMSLPQMQMNMLLMNVCLLFPFIYCVISPILLIRCLPGLQKSIRKLLINTCKCSSGRQSRRQTSIASHDS